MYTKFKLNPATRQTEGATRLDMAYDQALTGSLNLHGILSDEDQTRLGEALEILKDLSQELLPA